MAKLWELFKYNLKESKHNKRFYTPLDMAECKHQEAIKASQIKRGERIDKPNNTIYVCGCGGEGCFIHAGYDNKKIEKTDNQ